jgi:hypothetical protein
MELLMLSLWLGSQPNLTEIATAVGRINPGGATLTEKLPVSRFNRVATAAAIKKNHVPVQHINLRPEGGLPMILRRRGNRAPAPVAVACPHPSG